MKPHFKKTRELSEGGHSAAVHATTSSAAGSARTSAHESASSFQHTYPQEDLMPAHAIETSVRRRRGVRRYFTRRALAIGITACVLIGGGAIAFGCSNSSGSTTAQTSSTTTANATASTDTGTSVLDASTVSALDLSGID